MQRWGFGTRGLAVAGVVALLAGGLAPVVLAGPGSGDSVTYTWLVHGQQICFKVTNGSPKGKPIFDFHAHVSSGTMVFANVLSSPPGWTGTASPADATWTTTTAPIKMHQSLDDFCLNVSSSDAKITWETTDKAGGVISSGSFTVI